MFPKIPKELILQLEHAKRINKIYQNFLSKENIAHIQLAVQQHKQLDTQAIQNLASAAKQFQMYDNLIPNYKGLNEALNSIISAYETSKNDEFEITIENVPVIIIKSTIKEMISFYVNKGINVETALRLAISSYIFIKIYPIIFMINSKELSIFLDNFSKYIYSCGSSVLKLSIQKYYEFQDPEEFAKFLVDQGTSALFGFILGILK